MGIRLCRSALSRKLAGARAMAARIVPATQGATLTDLATYLGRERFGFSQAAGYMVSAETPETHDQRKA